MSKSKLLITAALALTGALGTGMAQAQGADVQWSVTIGTPVRSPAKLGPQRRAARLTDRMSTGTSVSFRVRSIGRAQ